MYEVVILNSAAKQLRKLDNSVKNRIISMLEQLALNPWSGERLKGDLAAIYSCHLKTAGIEYRIAYQIKEPEILVIVIQIGTRRNFYEELKKRIK
ncbi:MAG TPA: type II toxin-antitoxin system RelE/ParE family toxin [Bacillota bacterium]|nr:type II toxin-antitoxin system RelE/ParE family toxin [Bacillota bacterium]